MLSFISKQFASKALLILFSLIIIFHALALLEIIPYQMLWGGRLQSFSQLLVFESISITLNAAMMMIVLIHTKTINISIHQRVTEISLKAMSALFLLNTLGNIFSDNELEKIIFTPITLVLAILCWRLASE